MKNKLINQLTSEHTTQKRRFSERESLLSSAGGSPREWISPEDGRSSKQDRLV